MTTDESNLMETVVNFTIVIGTHPVPVSAKRGDSLTRLFQGLLKNSDAAKHISARVSSSDCEFYRLRRPVSTIASASERNNLTAFRNRVIQECLAESNKEPVLEPSLALVDYLEQEFHRTDIYLLIKLPDPFKASNDAIGKLKEDYKILFKCLHVTVSKSGAWCHDDVTRNLQGGIHTEDINNLPPTFADIQDALAQPRVYDATGGISQRLDLQNALSYMPQFTRVFRPGEPDSRTVTSEREFVAFYNLLRCFDGDVSRIASNSSSSLKASNFTVHFVQPPFFSEIDDSRGFQYQPEKNWRFPIFVDTESLQDACRKFTPRSDWAVVSPQYEIPFVISEVISQKQEQDRSRMLVEAIAAARVGQFLLRSTSKRNSFVVAIYVDAHMIASRYIVMQTRDGNAKRGDKPVSIHRKDFDLRAIDEEVDFLREMYNLATQITSLSRDLDQRKQNVLHQIRNASSKVISLSKKVDTKTLGNATMGSIPEEREENAEPQDEDGFGVFEAQDIQLVLHQMNYRIEFIPWGHPYLAVIANDTDDKRGFLKFTKQGKETSVLKYLSAIESPSNHTIADVRFWPVEGGTVISMPVAGGWLTSLRNPDEQLWSVSEQLVEALAFMHEHHVAHMDIKPQNVIIPVEGGRLSIIDFSVSIRVRGPDVRYSGVVGTEDYIAPEVHEGHYKPMLADLWSCGRTLEELCACCRPSAERNALLEICGRLMDKDPEARPNMSTVLEWMTSVRRGGDNSEGPALPALPTISVLPVCTC